MPRIINTFSSNNPLASSIKSLGESFFGDQLTPALKKQQLADAQREALAHTTQADVVGAANADGTFDFAKAAQAAALGGLKPEDLAMLTSFTTGNMGGYKSPGANNALFAAGHGNASYDNMEADRNNTFNMNTADNVQSGANNKYSADTTAATSIANNTQDNAGLMDRFNLEPKPATMNGQPTFIPQGQLSASGAAPILNDNQITPLDAFNRQLLASGHMFPGDPAKARAHAIAQLSKTTSKGVTVFGPDGNPIVEMGGSADGSVGPLTNANETRQQADLINTTQFKTTVDMADKLLDANPGAVGAQGNLKHGFQSATILVKGLTDSLGYPDLQSAWADTQAQALAMGVKPETLSFDYDPAFAEISTLYNIMTFQAVKAIGQQSGNDASNRDFQVIKDTLGDPKDWLTNSQDLKTRLKIVKNYVDLKQKQTRQTLGLPAVDAATTPAPGATPAAPAGAEENWTIGPDGKPLRVQ